MIRFFSGLFTAGHQTARALLLGPSTNLEEMRKAQWARASAFTTLTSALNYTSNQILSRRQYWCAQTFFLAKLLESNPSGISKIINSKFTVINDVALLEVTKKLINAFDDPAHVKEFLALLNADSERVENIKLEQTEGNVPAMDSGPQFHCGDVIKLVQNPTAEGRIIVVDNAPNSHRDGATKDRARNNFPFLVESVKSSNQIN